MTESTTLMGPQHESPLRDEPALDYLADRIRN